VCMQAARSVARGAFLAGEPMGRALCCDESMDQFDEPGAANRKASAPLAWSAGRVARCGDPCLESASVRRLSEVPKLRSCATE
jgi:hypothetical protein